MTIRVVLAEDHYLVREGVRRLVEPERDLELVAVCGSYEALLAAVQQHVPDVVVTDIRMPPTSTDEGVRAAAMLRHSHPDLGVVLLSQYVEPSYAVSLLEDGAARRAYLLKERVASGHQLVSAIREVAQGGSVIDPQVVEALVAARARGRTSPLSRLSPREREVLALMAEGRSNAGIGEALTLTERAVEKHINSMFTKLGLAAERDVNRRVKAVLLFLAEDRPDA